MIRSTGTVAVRVKLGVQPGTRLSTEPDTDVVAESVIRSDERRQVADCLGSLTDLQRQAIAEGLPWERCKAFDRSAALSPQFVSLQELGGDVQSLHFTLEVNGQTRQRGDTSGMLFSVDRIIASVSQYMTLRMGDLLYTGTPAGVGPVRPGDNLRAVLEGRELLNFDIR